MAKDKTDKKKEKKDKKRSETDGVHKHKKDKKEKKSALTEAAEKDLTTQVLEGLDQADTQAIVVNGDAEVTMTETLERPIGALVPFANPLVGDKTAKKVLKSVKKGKPYLTLLVINNKSNVRSSRREQVP
jgi:H/ACA ribonucleoprotein complex subunit 2